MNVDELVEEVLKWPMLEVLEFSKKLQERTGVTPMAMAAPAAAPTEAAPAAEEKTTFDVILTGFGDKKIQVIKAIREVTPLGLTEAKTLVESAPKAVKEGVTKEEAESIKAKIAEAGGTAEIK